MQIEGVRPHCKEPSITNLISPSIPTPPKPQTTTAAFASWRRIANQQLATEMAGIMHSFKQAYGGSGQWAAMEGRLEPALLGRLRELYGV